MLQVLMHSVYLNILEILNILDLPLNDAMSIKKIHFKPSINFMIKCLPMGIGQQVQIVGMYTMANLHCYARAFMLV